MGDAPIDSKTRPDGHALRTHKYIYMNARKQARTFKRTKLFGNLFLAWIVILWILKMWINGTQIFQQLWQSVSLFVLAYFVRTAPLPFPHCAIVVASRLVSLYRVVFVSSSRMIITFQQEIWKQQLVTYFVRIACASFNAVLRILLLATMTHTHSGQFVCKQQPYFGVSIKL